MNFFLSFTSRIARFLSLFPCPACREVSGNGNNLFCRNCREKLPLYSPDEPRCPGCGGRADGTLAVCSLCLAEPQRPWRNALALMEYRGYGKDLLRRFKFRNTPELARPFGEMMAEYFRSCGGRAEGITFIPLPALRELRRSYNQAELLARRLAKEIQLPVFPTLKRFPRRGKQSARNRRDRHKELKASFALLPGAKESIRGKRILLIDDVLTTGATLHAAAEEILKADPASLDIFVLARTPVRFKNIGIDVWGRGERAARISRA